MNVTRRTIIGFHLHHTFRFVSFVLFHLFISHAKIYKMYFCHAVQKYILYITVPCRRRYFVPRFHIHLFDNDIRVPNPIIRDQRTSNAFRF